MTKNELARTRVFFSGRRQKEGIRRIQEQGGKRKIPDVTHSLSTHTTTTVDETDEWTEWDGYPAIFTCNSSCLSKSTNSCGFRGVFSSRWGTFLGTWGSLSCLIVDPLFFPPPTVSQLAVSHSVSPFLASINRSRLFREAGAPAGHSGDRTLDTVCAMRGDPKACSCEDSLDLGSRHYPHVREK